MLTRCWWFVLCGIGAVAAWAVSAAIRHPLKAEMWLVAAAVLGILAVAERLER